MLSRVHPSGGELSSYKKMDLLILGNNSFDGVSRQSVQLEAHIRILCVFIVHNHFCYMVKPHGQLVLVSSTRHRAYTPSLSTS